MVNRFVLDVGALSTFSRDRAQGESKAPIMPLVAGRAGQPCARIYRAISSGKLDWIVRGGCTGRRLQFDLSRHAPLEYDDLSGFSTRHHDLIGTIADTSDVLIPRGS